MIVHPLEEEGGILMQSYGSLYYAFVLMPNEDETFRVIIYDPSSGETLYRKIFDEDPTSIVTLQSTVYISMQTGRIMELKQDDLTKPFTVTFLEDLGGWKSQGSSITLLGIDNDVIYVASKTSNRRARCSRQVGWDTVTLYSRQQSFSVKSSRIVNYEFDPKTHRLLLVTEKDQRFHLHIVSPTAADATETACYQSYEIRNPWDKSTMPWNAVAISTYGEVAFCNQGGRFWIVNPTLTKQTSQFVKIGSIWRPNSGGSACFAGPRDEYLAYSGFEYSEIAAAKFSDGKWLEIKPLIAGTGELYMTNRHTGALPGTSLYDLGTDGRSLIVRLGPDRTDEDSLGVTSNMLWTFDLLNSRGLRLR